MVDAKKALEIIQKSKKIRDFGPLAVMIAILGATVVFTPSMFVLVVIMIYAIFSLGCLAGSLWAGRNGDRQLREQESRLLAELGAAHDANRQMKNLLERGSVVVAVVVGILKTDKRSGDKAIGDARRSLESALQLMSGQPTDDEVREEIIRRLEAVDCPAERTQEILDMAMEHTPRATTAVAKLRAVARVLESDIATRMGDHQPGDAVVADVRVIFCQRAATVKLSPEPSES